MKKSMRKQMRKSMKKSMRKSMRCFICDLSKVNKEVNEMLHM